MQKITMVDVTMCKERRTDADAPVGSLLGQYSQKAACHVTHNIESQVEEGAQRKSSQADGPHKRLAIGFP